MTAPKRWPKNAEAARVESLAAAMRIVELGQEAKDAIVAGRRDLAIALVSEMQLGAKTIEVELRTCKGGGIKDFELRRFPK